MELCAYFRYDKGVLSEDRGSFGMFRLQEDVKYVLDSARLASWDMTAYGSYVLVSFDTNVDAYDDVVAVMGQLKGSYTVVRSFMEAERLSYRVSE